VSATVEIREQGRGVAGALLVLGISFTYTIETWWLASQVPIAHLLGFVFAGLVLVLVITRNIGFRDQSIDRGETAARVSLYTEFAEVVFQSLVAGYGMLFLFGIVTLKHHIGVLIRIGLVQLVPLAFGASLANELLSGEQEEVPELAFPWNIGVYAIGAVFVAGPIAPTEEVVILAVQSGWRRLAAILLVTLFLTYAVLYELEFRGQSRRQPGSRALGLGQACVVYVVGGVVALGLLIATGDIGGQPLSMWVQQTIVLAFPASIGASGARVVIG